MNFLQCCSLSLLFWFLLRIILWNGRWQRLPRALCYCTQHYYNLGTMCLKIKDSKDSSLYTLVFPWLSCFQSYYYVTFIEETTVTNSTLNFG